jgi:hypothetical protein
MELYFYGKRNRDETIKSVLLKGMKDAEEIVISGCSAGGLNDYRPICLIVRR